MAWRNFPIALLFLSTVSFPACAAPFEFKGIRSGDRAAQHREKLGDWQSDLFDKSKPCRSHNRGTIDTTFQRRFQTCPLRDNHLSGSSAEIAVLFEQDGPLAAVSGAFLVPTSIVTEAFTLKYGKPASRVGSGAIWRFDDGVLTVKDLGLRVPGGTFEFVSTAYQAFLDEVAERQRPRPKVDF